MKANKGPLLIVGTGSTAEVVLDAIRAHDPVPQVIGFLDFDGGDGSVGALLRGIPVLDSYRAVGQYRSRVAAVIPAVLSRFAREEILALLAREGVPVAAIVHPSVVVGGDVIIEEGSVIQAGVVIGMGARIGRAALVQTGAIVGEHCRVGDFSTVGSGAKLGGGVRLGERAEVGMGSSVLDGLAIGPEAIVGAGAVVSRDMEQGTSVSGAADLLPERDPV